MQRHRQNHIDTIYIPEKPERRQEKFAKRSSQLYFAPVLKVVDNFGSSLIVHQRCTGNAELIAGRQTSAAEMILALSAGKRDTATIAKRRFNRDQISEALGTQTSGQGQFRLGTK
jgi:hypothetical protein